MRRLLKYFTALVVILIVLVIGAVAYAWVSTSRRVSKTYQVNTPPIEVPRGEAAAVDRGRYLVHKVSLCVECHGEDLGGKRITEFPVDTLWGSNLTAGRGGIGATYTDQDFVRALVHGVKKDGRSVVFMPSHDYRFTKTDIAALVAYLRTVPPVDRETAELELGFMGRMLATYVPLPLLPAELIDHSSERLVPEGDRDDPAAAGDYLIHTAGCRGCHGPALDAIGGMPDAANLTPTGIGGWTEEDFKTAIREARRPNGTTILPAMPRIYKEIPDEELSRIFAYLRTLKPSGEKTQNQRAGDVQSRAGG